MRCRSGLMLVIMLALHLVAVSSFGCSESAPSADAVAKRVAASLVTITSSGTNTVSAGVVYSYNGLILTSTSIGLDDQGKPLSSFKVTLSDGETMTTELAGANMRTGVAVLRVMKEGLSPVTLATGKPQVGEWVALVSNMGSSITSTPASVVSVSTSLSDNAGLTVKSTKSLQVGIQPEAFDKQGNLVGLVIGSGGSSSTFSLLSADKVASELAGLGVRQ